MFIFFSNITKPFKSTGIVNRLFINQNKKKKTTTIILFKYIENDNKRPYAYIFFNSKITFSALNDPFLIANRVHSEWKIFATKQESKQANINKYESRTNYGLFAVCKSQTTTTTKLVLAMAKSAKN